MSEQKKQFLVDTFLKVQSPPGYFETVMRGLLMRLPIDAPEAPDEFVDVVKKELGEDFVRSELGKIYAEHFDEEELQEMIDFWISPVGKKSRSPVLMRQIKALPEQWAERVKNMWRDYSRGVVK